MFFCDILHELRQFWITIKQKKKYKSSGYTICKTNNKTQKMCVIKILNLRQNLWQMIAKRSKNNESYTKLWVLTICHKNTEKWSKIKENQHFQGVSDIWLEYYPLAMAFWIISIVGRIYDCCSLLMMVLHLYDFDNNIETMII